MTQAIRVAHTGEVTTLAKLADEGRIQFTTCLMDGKKRAGERKTVRRYFADLIETDNGNGGVSGWEISETAYKSRTGETITIGER